MRCTSLLFLVFALAACAPDKDAHSTGAGDEASESTSDVELSDAELMASLIVGTWWADKIEVVFLDEDDNWLTIPTSVYPDRWTDLIYTDGTPDTRLKLSSELTYFADGTMFNVRDFKFDHDGDGVPDEDSMTQETSGVWRAKEGSVVMDTEDFYVESSVDFLSDDEAYFVWDRDDPLFMDNSCVFTMNSSRVSSE